MGWTVRVNMTPILILMGAVLFDRSSRFCRALDHTIVHLTLRDVIRHPPSFRFPTFGYVNGMPQSWLQYTTPSPKNPFTRNKAS